MSKNEKNSDFVRLLKKGKEEAFRAIFVTYFESLEVFAKAYVLEQEIARDIIQEVFFILWEKKASLPEKTNLKAYLYQITRNSCLNYLKKLKVQAKYEKRVLDNYNDLLLNCEALSRLNFDTLSFNELFETLNNAIGSLPPKCREVFELSRNEGLKNKEIAVQLNISVKAVEGHISKALRQIKEQLKKFYFLL